MIIALLFIPFRMLINFLISLLPSTPSVEVVITGFSSIMGHAISLFGVDVFGLVITNITLWSVINVGWAVIEWVYRKIPGVS